MVLRYSRTLLRSCLCPHRQVRHQDRSFFRCRLSRPVPSMTQVHRERGQNHVPGPVIEPPPEHDRLSLRNPRLHREYNGLRFLRRDGQTELRGNINGDGYHPREPLRRQR